MIAENPFPADYDLSRIHLTFTNHELDRQKLAKIQSLAFEGKIFEMGSSCLHIYLPRDAAKKKLNNNFLEKKLGIVATTRKLSVVKNLFIRMKD